jgi:hypothetical protein
MITQVPDDLDLLRRYVGANRGHQVRGLITGIPGVSLSDGHEGKLAVGERRVLFRVVSEDHVEIFDPVDRPPAADEALALHGRLPGNLRFACVAGRSVLLAEVPLDGPPQLLESLEEIRRGIARALGDGDPEDIGGEPVSADVVEKALGESGLKKDDIVRLERRWEVRLRIRGEVVSVFLTAESAGVRLRCKVLAALADACDRQALGMHALRANAQLRFARLATSDDALVTETRLHRGLVQGRFVAMAARAVAVAHVHTRVAMEILARDAGVAKSFKHMFVQV